MTEFQFIHQGNIFDSCCEALVNTVNCVGVMGKGLALEFKKKFPENFELYNDACRANEVFIGRMFTTWEPDERIYIINFPTKLHWRNPSQYKWIESGLIALKKEIKDLDIRSIAIPPLGCGLGGLEWHKVRDMIEVELADFDKLRVKVYCP